jgi:hypothetical protein
MLADDLKRLRGAIVVAAVMLGVGAGLVFASERLRSRSKEELLNALRDRETIQVKASRSREEEQEVNRDLVRYRELQASGVVGGEKRLEWVESVERIRLGRRLPDITYEIAAQQRFGSPNPAVSDFYFSTMRLDLPLLHEGDLFTVLADLRQTAPGYFRVHSCSLRSQVTLGNEAGSLTPRVIATCALEFLSIEGKNDEARG